MWRSEAWTILGELWDNANEHQRKALRIAQNDIEFVDLMPDDMVAVVRCKNCKKCMLWRKPTDGVIGECYIRKMNSDDERFCLVGADDFCSYGERKDGEG